MYGGIQRALVTLCVLGLPTAVVLGLYGVLSRPLVVGAVVVLLLVALLADRPWHLGAGSGRHSWDRLAGDIVHEDMIIMNRGMASQPPSIPRRLRR